MIAGVAGTGVPLLILLVVAVFVILKQRRSYRRAMMTSHERVASESWKHQRAARYTTGREVFAFDKNDAVELYTPTSHEVLGDDRLAHELDTKYRSSMAPK